MAVPVWLWWVGGAVAVQQAARAGVMGEQAQQFAQRIQSAITRGPGTGESVSAVAAKLGVTREEVELAMIRTNKPAGSLTVLDVTTRWGPTW
jgi:hypothetical protein